MTSTLAAWLATLSGPVLFVAAYFIHQKIRLTRFACVVAVVAGFITYTAAIGTRANAFASQLRILLVAGMLVGIAVIVADIKGKRRGADRPALFAFFLVPVFLVAFVSSLPAVAQQFGTGVEKVGTSVTTQMGR